MGQWQSKPKPQPEPMSAPHKKPLWQWLLACVIVGGVLLGLIYYFFNLKMYNSGLNTQNQEQAQGIAVSIANFAFAPGALTVKKGESVTWTNNDEATHTIVSDDANGPASPELKKGDSWTLPFWQAGTFAYHCSLHPTMKGTIQISE